MVRPSNRELKVLSHLGADAVLGPDDFKDVGEKVFAGLVKKGWIEPAPGGFRNTDKGKRIHDEEMLAGRWKR
jgi:hypothetical protein